MNKLFSGRHHTIELWPSSLSHTLFITGIESIEPITGTLLRKFIITGKKPLNSKKNPYASMSIPIKGHPNRTTNIPVKKNPLDLILCLWKKKLNVLCKPMINDRPLMKRRLPNAMRTRSKKNSIPRNKKKPPKPARPIPIFWESVTDSILNCLSFFYVMNDGSCFTQ